MDTWIPDEGAWVTHTLTTVRIIEKNQRLLYRVRRGLVDVVKECVGLDDELMRQKTKSGQGGIKRRAHDLTSPLKSSALNLDGSPTKRKRDQSPIADKTSMDSHTVGGPGGVEPGTTQDLTSYETTMVSRTSIGLKNDPKKVGTVVLSKTRDALSLDAKIMRMAR
ncbi:hypothetical protein JB92DRAFT_2841014 [Gautieria morchelliformis]|nr:hypothetical protein JB92DRAFT_2841014 [Gautieria morchelliformis]